MTESTKIKTKRRAIPEMVRNYILKRDGFQCLCCGSSEKLEIDHIRPFAQNGKTEIDNLQTLCKQCNKDKADKHAKRDMPVSITGIREKIINNDFSLKDETQKVIKRTEILCIRIALNEMKWNRRKTAKVLGISYRSLLYKIKEYGLIN